MSSSHPSIRPNDNASRTLTITPTPSDSDAGPSNPGNASRENSVGMLRLRGGPARQQKVMWSEETVDNESMGKKKSKICCIYHRPKAYDESSSESSSDDEPIAQQVKPKPKPTQDQVQSSESEGGAGSGKARPPRRKKPPHHHSPHCNASGDKPKANKYDHKGGPK